MAPIRWNGDPIDPAAVNGVTFVYVSVSAVLVICVGFFVVFACACCEKRKRKDPDRSQISISEKIDLTIPPPEMPKEWEAMSPKTWRDKPEPIVPKELKSPELKSETLKPLDPKSVAVEHISASNLMWKRGWKRHRTLKPLHKGQKEAEIAESGKVMSKLKKDGSEKKKRHRQRRSHEEESSCGSSGSLAFPFEYLTRRELIRYLRDRNRYENREEDDLMREVNEWRRQRRRDQDRKLDKRQRMMGEERTPKNIEDYRHDYLRKTKSTSQPHPRNFDRPQEPVKASVKEEPKVTVGKGKREPSVRKIVPSALVPKPGIGQGIHEHRKGYETLPIEDFTQIAKAAVKSCRDEVGRKENRFDREKEKAPMESKYV